MSYVGRLRYKTKRKGNTQNNIVVNNGSFDRLYAVNNRLKISADKTEKNNVYNNWASW